MGVVTMRIRRDCGKTRGVDGSRLIDGGGGRLARRHSRSWMYEMFVIVIGDTTPITVVHSLTDECQHLPLQSICVRPIDTCPVSDVDNTLLSSNLECASSCIPHLLSSMQPAVCPIGYTYVCSRVLLPSDQTTGAAPFHVAVHVHSSRSSGMLLLL